MPRWLVHSWAMLPKLPNCDPNCSRKGLPGGIYDSGFASLGRSLLPWLGINTNEAMIRNLSLTLESTAGSTAKQQPPSKDPWTFWGG